MLFRLLPTALKDVCSPSGGFIARYGGDEFVVLQKAAAEQDIMHLCATINDELAYAEVPYSHCGCPSVARGYGDSD